jgi:CRP-like cAMP-binding protein
LDTNFFFVITGDCIVNFTDYNMNEHVAVKLLTEGLHFGEIGMLYKTARTATIIARSYNMVGYVTRRVFLDTCSVLPDYENQITK